MQVHPLKLAACGLLAANTMAAEAATVNYFLKIGDIKGSSTDKTYKEFSSISEFSWEISATPPKKGAPADSGTVTVSDLHWSQVLDIAAPKLMEGITSGTLFKAAELDLVKPNGGAGFKFFSLVFTNVYLTEFNLHGSQNVPTIDGAFNFEKVVMTIIPELADGKPGTPVDATYDAQSLKFSGATGLAFLQLADLSGPVILSAPTTVPLPASLPFLVSGLAAVVAAGRRRRAA